MAKVVGRVEPVRVTKEGGKEFAQEVTVDEKLELVCRVNLCMRRMYAKGESRVRKRLLRKTTFATDEPQCSCWT